MDANMIMMQLQDKLPKDPSVSMMLKQKLDSMDDAKRAQFGQEIAVTSFKSPIIAFVLAWFLGCLGVDRFYYGSIGGGVGKLALTLFGFLFFLFFFPIGAFLLFIVCIWGFVDLFLAFGGARKANWRKIEAILIRY